MTQRTILFVGGGSAGHLTPSIAVTQALRKKDPALAPYFVIADRDDERSLLTELGYPYTVLRAPKFPRSISLKTFVFPLNAIKAFVCAFFILRAVRPSILFSKGGYVAVPVTLVAWLLRIPIITHSSDSLTNVSDRVIGWCARKFCTGFPPSQLPSSLEKKVVYTGNPVRSIVGAGSRDAGKRITGFSGNRPVLMVIGGSQGSLAINTEIARSFDKLLTLADVIHITGQGKSTGKNHARYFSRPYVTEELPHLYALADLVVTRAGAGTLSELALLSKPAIVIPLTGVAHDHQQKNADIIASADACMLLAQEKITELGSAVAFLLASPERRADLGKNLHELFPLHAEDRVADVILDALRTSSLQS